MKVCHERVAEVDHGVPHVVEESNDSVEDVAGDGDGIPHDVLVVIEETCREGQGVDDSEGENESEK